MGELYDFAASVSERLGIPAEILSGLPMIELTGDSAIMIEQHRGITAYSTEEICISVNFGTVHIRGAKLTIHVMNRERIIIYGRVAEVGLERRRR